MKVKRWVIVRKDGEQTTFKDAHFQFRWVASLYLKVAKLIGLKGEYIITRKRVNEFL